uniref:Bactericidal permeability-increasing protein n=1 Tax=Esox lucius TaxID=8010 RepID=A0A6Q2YRB9_ESOLU
MLLFLILLLPCTNHAFGLNPAIKAVLASKGLKYGTHIGTDWMHEKILSMKVPDVTGGVYIGFGTVKYVLDGISVSSCDVPEPSVNFSEGSGLKIVINGLSIAVRVMVIFGLIGASFLFNLDLTLLVDIGSDDKGHMSILSKYCSARINSATINFHGGASWIFQPFVDCFKSRIKALIEEKICPLVDQHVADLEQYLTELQVSFQIDPIVVLDVPLTNAPLISSSSLGLDLKGEFYSIKSPKEPPFEAKAFDLPKDDGFMLSLGLSEFSFNSASYAYFDTGHLHITVTDEMIPPTSPLRLNTSYFGPFIPQLPKLFPNMLMLLEVYAREIPMFSFLPGEVTLDFPGAVKALAILPNRTLTPLFKLNADSLFSGKVYISEGKLKGLMELKNFTLTLASSEIGTFQVGYENAANDVQWLTLWVSSFKSRETKCWNQSLFCRLRLWKKV